MKKDGRSTSVFLKQKDLEILKKLKEIDFNFSLFVRRSLRKRFERMMKEKIIK